MISTVTTTVVALNSPGAGVLTAVGAAAVVTLIAALVIRELAAGGGLRLRMWGRNLDIIGAPLLVVLAFMVSVKVWEILS